MKIENDLPRRTRVALYIRVSTEEQALRGLSIEAQTEALDDWAEKNHVQVVGHYTDAGISARKPAAKRPELQRLLEDVQAGKIDLIAFTKLDRWFRNVSEYYKVQDILEQHYVDWRTIHEDYDTFTASGRLKINIMLSVAQDEADRTSERIKTVFERKKLRLEPLNAKTPVGYKVVNKKMVKDPEQEKMTEELFRKFMTCGSMSETQLFLLEEYGFGISYQTLSNTLKNKIYCGIVSGIEGVSPPYLTAEQFDRIQEMRKRPVRKAVQNRTYIFSGLVICGECGRRMSSAATGTSNIFFYKCDYHFKGKVRCRNNVCMNEKKLEAFLIERLAERLRQYKVEYEEIRCKGEHRNYKAEIAAVRSKIKKLQDLYMDDFIAMDDYKEKYVLLSTKLSELVEKDKPAKEPRFDEIESMIHNGWEEAYQATERSTKKGFWRSLLREIRIYPDRKIEFDLNV